jgi:drug/metabolite transporter (DMT)-like permease
MAASALIAAPVAAFFLPSSTPSLEAVGSLTALGVLGTGISFVLFYDLIANVGPAKASLVAYIAPGFAVVYGVTLRGEEITVATVAGLVLIVGGSWLAGRRRSRGEPVGEAVAHRSPAELQPAAAASDR